jgi:N-ethylmaleimide reductase
MPIVTRRTFNRAFLGSIGLMALTRGVASPGPSASARLRDPVAFNGTKLPNRMVMAPMTRGRAGAERTANALMAEYYAQRASAAFIVTEGTAISAQGYGWLGSPGIYTDAQAAGWTVVTDAVHLRGGRIFLQLWHTGRVSHADFLDGGTPVGPSAIAAKGDVHTATGKKPYVVPREMTEREIRATVQDYARAAIRARDAGFDGVEIHGANGYLVDQFIRDGSNHRRDAYGGTIQKRLRFLMEATEAASRAWSPDRVGVRLSPASDYNDMSDSRPTETFTRAAEALGSFRLAYLHVVENVSPAPGQRIAPYMRAAFGGSFILNGGYDAQTGAAALERGEADLIAYGRHFLANPDLVERFRQEAPLNSPDPSTFYTDEAQGYTDYPPLKP